MSLLLLSLFISCKNSIKQKPVTGLSENFEWFNSKSPYGSCSLRITTDKIIYVDPVDITDETANIKADIILITHEHSDHLQYDSIVKINKPSTVIISNTGIINTLKVVMKKKKSSTLKIIKPYEELTISGTKIEGITAYNNTHEKSAEGLGFVITNINGKRIYITGSTTFIHEMDSIYNIDYAVIFLKPSALTPEAAIKTINQIKPKKIIPIHWRDFEDEEMEALKKGVPSEIELMVLNIK